MRGNLIPILIAAFVTIGAIAGIFIYHGFEFARINEVDRIVNSQSGLFAAMTIRYDKPPVYEESYRMQDLDGVSTTQYKITGYSGKVITITAPSARVHDVSFFFGKLVQDGVWNLVNQPPRGDTSKQYTVYVKQIVYVSQSVSRGQGSRTIIFTDPHYWATTAGRQYTIDLGKNNPSDLVKMQSTALADPHYEAVVDDFYQFGSPSFRKKIASAQATIRGGR